MLTIFRNGTLVLPTGLVENGLVVINDNGRITSLGQSIDDQISIGKQIDLGLLYLCPGLIDIHVHGGHGVTFGEGDLLQNLADYSRWVSSNGVTGFLLSLAEATPEDLIISINAYKEIANVPLPGARMLGFHLEGPYLNPVRKGAFNPSWLRSPGVDEVSRIIQAGEGFIRQITLAPELPQAAEVAALCRQNGILVAMGHTDSSYEEAEAALKGDFNHVTHTFNAQRGFDHRQPGVVGAVLISEKITAEIIADNVHVHPAAIKLLIRCLGVDRVIAITDAMSAAGLSDGVYHLVGEEVLVQGGKAMQRNGTLAGSITTLNRCLEILVKLVGLPLEQAVQMASLNPARVIGLSANLGSIEPGKDADLTVIDQDFNVCLTMIKGKIVFDRLTNAVNR